MAKINFDYYKEKDNYCYYVLNNLDNDTIELLKNPENDQTIKEKNSHLYYYLLNKRNNELIDWWKLKGDCTVLEISGGLGLQTELFCKKASSVTTICFSKTNAEIMASRLSGYDNLDIIVGDFREAQFDKKFDYIVISDVFEFSKAFFKNELLFINHLKGLLAENGKIFCTVSNKYGIGNFSGCVSHITGNAFDEINNYPKVPFLSGYTKRELTNIFQMAGFEKIKFYYPLPNHYENRIILSDKSLNKIVIGDKIPNIYRHYGINPNRLVDEFHAVKSGIYDGRFTSMVNSYLIIVGKEDKDEQPYYIQQEDAIRTTLTDDSCVKTALTEKSAQTLDKMYEFYQNETKRIEELGIKNIKYAHSEKQGNSLIMELAKGRVLNEIGLKILFDYNKFLAFGLEYKSLINKIYPNVKYQNYNFEDITLENVACVENANIDLNLSNIFKDGDNYTITDYDKTAPIIPLNYILAQGIFVFMIDTGFAFKDVEYLKQLGLSEQEIRCYQMIFSKKNKIFQR